MQLNINRHSTPDTLTLRLHQDPFDPAAPLRLTAQVWAVDGSVLAAHVVDLKSIEADFVDTIIAAAVDCWRWGAPQSQLVTMMKYHHRRAKEHRKAHEG